MALHTAKTYLFYESGVAVFTKLVDIVGYPDMGSAPNTLDTTDLSAEKMKTKIRGLQESPDLTFECNYDEDAYDLIDGLADTKKKFQLHFGTGGADGKFQWEGTVSVFVSGGGVDEVRKMTVTCVAETEIAKI
jgi:hypothetical protein